MSYEHNQMAHKVSKKLLSDLRASRAPWTKSFLSGATTLWQGVADWPRPDIAFQDTKLNASIALEFKPPNQPKREYVTGLGQAITYLNEFRYAGLVLPTVANDGYRIADYIGDMFTGILKEMPLAVFSYEDDPANLTVIRGLQARSDGVTIPSSTGRKAFWGYWRDLSNFELYEMLCLLDAQKHPNFESMFSKFWRSYASKGKALTWEGAERKIKSPDAKGKISEQTNVKQAMRHAGLIDSGGHMTEDGYALLRIGKIYSPSSVAFLERLARQVLYSARHLDLIFWIEETQRLVPKRQKQEAKAFYRQLDLSLDRAGIITAPKRGAAKAAFLRDEPKLWNKLGLLIHSNKTQYFHPGVGLIFDWRKIISVIDQA